MSNTPKMHDNSKVHEFLDGYSTASELCRDFPAIDDILSGVLQLKTSGDTATRSLSRWNLFGILQSCPVINVESVNSATNGRYAYNTVAGYAAVARVASKAIEQFIISRMIPAEKPVLTIREERTLLDAPYQDELMALGLI